MEVSACPACGTDEIGYEQTEISTFPLVSWRPGDTKPVFVASKEAMRTEATGRIVCVNGHAHPDRVGFDLEWASRPKADEQPRPVSSSRPGV